MKSAKATSKRVRTTITTRVDSPTPRRRSRKKKSGAAVGIILLALFLLWVVSQPHIKGPRPVPVQVHR